jgi:hypothetical protein
MPYWSYGPAERAERQHELNTIPASGIVDQRELKAALVAYETAKADERAARLTAEVAEQGLPESEYADALALADAQAAGEKDPGAKNRTKALNAIAEARRQHAASKITLARAVDAVTDSFNEHAAGWESELEAERDQLRSTAGELLDGWERVWRMIQRNAACRSMAKGSRVGASPASFASRFKVPQILDGDVIQVEDVLAGLRDLAKPEQPRTDIVANVELGADPTRQQHTPPSRQPFAGMGSSPQMLGGRVPQERVDAWVEKDAAEARAAAMSPERRAERQARADERIAQREAQREADNEAAEMAAK